MIHYNLATSTFLSAVGLALKSSRKQNMLLRIDRVNWEIYKPLAGESGILLHRKGKFM
jgi:hypothetical protein